MSMQREIGRTHAPFPGANGCSWGWLANGTIAVGNDHSGGGRELQWRQKDTVSLTLDTDKMTIQPGKVTHAGARPTPLRDAMELPVGISRTEGAVYFAVGCVP